MPRRNSDTLPPGLPPAWDLRCAEPLIEPEETVWVFGYGSLCWKPGFQFRRRLTGKVRGYSRRFWQGNTAHRGTPDQPGRVATLIEDADAEVWGVGFEVTKSSGALSYLWERECSLGGYAVVSVRFSGVDGTVIPDCLAYLATDQSSLWLGPAPPSEVASQIACAVGPAGSNAEYLLELSAFLRRHAPPQAMDPHLCLLDLLVRHSILCKKENLSNEQHRFNNFSTYKERFCKQRSLYEVSEDSSLECSDCSLGPGYSETDESQCEPDLRVRSG